MEPLCFAIKLFGISKLGVCKNGNFITKCGKRTNKTMMSGCGEQHIFIWRAAYILSLSSSLLAKWFIYILRQGDVEESIQVCESWGGCPVSLEDVSDSWVVLGLSWSGSCTHIFSGRPNKIHHVFGYVWVSSLCFSSIFCELNQEQISFWSCSCKPVILILH